MDSISVIPRPKQFQADDGYFEFARSLPIQAHSAAVRPVAEYCRRELEKLFVAHACKCPVQAGPASRPHIVLEQVARLAGIPDQREGYRIEVQSRRIILRAVTASGLLHAVHALLDLPNLRSGRWLISKGVLQDWPDFAWRGFLVDPARKFIPLARLKSHIDLLARNRMNILHVHFTDNEGFTIQSKRWPALNERPYHPMLYGTPRGVFTVKELGAVEADYAGVYSWTDLRELVAYGRARGVEILPEISMPSHSAAIIRVFPELKCRTTAGGTSEMILCLGNEKTYWMLERIIDELAPLFPYEVFHIGSDEIDCRDVLYQGQMFCAQRWRDCTVCRERMRREGFRHERELFYYFVRRIRRRLKQHGKRLMLWNDYIDISKPVPLPRDILIHFWQIALKQRGPRSGCSFARFLKAGFEIVNTHSWDTYIDEAFLMQEKKLIRWNPATTPYAPPELRRRIVGGEMCAWAHFEHYVRTVPPGLAVFADRVWNQNPIADVPTYVGAVARHLFGPALLDDLRDMFARFGVIIPPRSCERRIAPEDMTMPESAVHSAAKWRALARRLAAARRRPGIWNAPFLEELQISAEMAGKEKETTYDGS